MTLGASRKTFHQLKILPMVVKSYTPHYTDGRYKNLRTYKAVHTNIIHGQLYTHLILPYAAIDPLLVAILGHHYIFAISEYQFLHYYILGS